MRNPGSIADKDPRRLGLYEHFLMQNKICLGRESTRSFRQSNGKTHDAHAKKPSGKGHRMSELFTAGHMKTFELFIIKR